MSNYKDSFKFNVTDIDLIEEALRNEISVLTRLIHLNTDAIPPDVHKYEGKIKNLHVVLGKIHNQKIWYGQVHHTGTPISG